MPALLAPRSAPRLLMCRPTYYAIAYEINPWMSLKRQADLLRARQQWQRLYALLTRRLKVRVELLPPRRGAPDLTFTANAGLVTGRTFIRSNFRYPQRQAEEPIVERYFARAGFRIVRLDARYDFEGEGDALWMGASLVLGFRFRSDAPIHTELARLLRARVLPVELVDRRFYHLDTCFCPLDARHALWFPDAFDRYGRRVIEHIVEEPIRVGEADALRFACNAIAIGRSVVMHEGVSGGLQRRLVRCGFRPWFVDLSEFLKSGGSAKCLVLRVTPPAGGAS